MGHHDSWTLTAHTHTSTCISNEILQQNPLHFLHRTQNKRIHEKASGFPCWKARTLVVNGETTKALLVWPHHPTQYYVKKTFLQGTMEGLPEKNLLHSIDWTGPSKADRPCCTWQKTDQAKLTDPAAHGRRQTRQS